MRILSEPLITLHRLFLVHVFVSKSKPYLLQKEPSLILWGYISKASSRLDGGLMNECSFLKGDKRVAHWGGNPTDGFTLNTP